MEKFISIGDNVDIEIQNPFNLEESRILYSKVMNVDSEFIYLSPPVIKNNVHPIRIGQRAELKCYHETGIYPYTIIFNNQIDEGGLILYQVKIMADHEKIQRRKSVRFKCEAKGVLRSCESNKESDVHVFDISLGGILAYTRRPFYVREKVECTLFLGSNELKTKATVIRSLRKNRERLYELGLKFDCLTEEQKYLIRYMFEKQRIHQ